MLQNERPKSRAREKGYDTLVLVKCFIKIVKTCFKNERIFSQRIMSATYIWRTSFIILALCYYWQTFEQIAESLMIPAGSATNAPYGKCKNVKSCKQKVIYFTYSLHKFSKSSCFFPFGSSFFSVCLSKKPGIQNFLSTLVYNSYPKRDEKKFSPNRISNKCEMQLLALLQFFILLFMRLFKCRYYIFSKYRSMCYRHEVTALFFFI